MTSVLWLVATPIGNLDDLTPRAVEVLRGAALICCEDTRRTGRLLKHAGIRYERLAVTNDHTEFERIDDVLATLGDGSDVALVTDAGTPGISDPGERLVRAALDHGHTVSAVPGPAALVMALVISGMPTARFVFEGFLPRAGRQRSTRLGEIAGEPRTVVLYEAPHRLNRTLTDLVGVCGADRPAALCRELTKLHEEVVRGSLGELVARDTEPRGEYVIVLGGAPVETPAVDDAAIAAALRTAIGEGRSTRDAVDEVAARLDLRRRRVYSLALEIGAAD